MQTFQYEVESDVHFQGASSVRISSLVDMAGNSGEDVIAATGVSIDVVEPAVESLVVSSSGADWRFAAAGDVITVTVSSSEPIMVPSVHLRYFEWEGCAEGCDYPLGLSDGGSDEAGTVFLFSYVVDDSSFEGHVDAVVANVTRSGDAAVAVLEGLRRQG